MAYSINDVQAYLEKLERARLVRENEERQQKIRATFDADKKKELEDQEKLFVDIIRGVQAVSPKAFAFLIRDVPTANAVAAYFNDFMDLAAIMAAPPPVNWFGLTGKFVGIIFKLFSSLPSASISDSQRLIVIQNNVNALLLSAANDDKQFRIDKLAKAIGVYKLVNTRISNVYKTHPNLSGELYPWRKDGDETEESLLVEMRKLLTEVFNVGSRVWKSKFFPQDWSSDIQWKNYIADLVPYEESVAKSPRNLDDVFDARVTIDYFIEYVGLMLTMFSLRTPQYRSLGIYKSDIEEMVGVVEHLISGYKKIYYFDTQPDAHWTGGTLGGGGQDILGGSSSNPPNQWNIVAGQAGPAFGAVHPGMAVGIVTVLNLDAHPRLPSNLEVKNNVYVDEFSREQLEIVMGVPVLQSLRRSLLELSRPPYESETVRQGARLYWNNLWEKGRQTIDINVPTAETFHCYPVSRRAVQWLNFSIAQQRASGEFTDIPAINYSFFIKSNSNGERIPLVLGTQTVVIETKVMNTVLVSETDYDGIEENIYGWPNKFTDISPRPLMETKSVSLVCHLIKSDTGDYELRLSTELPNINAMFSFIVHEQLPVISELPPFHNVDLETKCDILLVGNGILVPDELFELVTDLMIGEAVSKIKFARQAAPFKEKINFLETPFTKPVEELSDPIGIRDISPSEFKSIQSYVSTFKSLPNKNFRQGSF